MVDSIEAAGGRRRNTQLTNLPGVVQTASTPAVDVKAMVAPQLEQASALTELGQALGTLGSRLDAAGVPAAQAAGLAAVGRDADGNPTVELKAFALSKSDQAFNEAATAGLLSRYQTDLQKGLVPIAQQHANDPKAFEVEARNYLGSAGKGLPAELRPQVRELGEKLVGQHSLSIQNSAIKRQTASAKDSILVDIDTTTNELNALARRSGITTPEFQEANAKLGALYSQLKANPLFEVAAARADAELSSTRDRAQGFAMASEATRIYDAQGEKTAQKARRQCPRQSGPEAI